MFYGMVHLENYDICTAHWGSRQAILWRLEVLDSRVLEYHHLCTSATQFGHTSLCWHTDWEALLICLACETGCNGNSFSLLRRCFTSLSVWVLSSEGKDLSAPNQLFFYQNPQFQADKSVYCPPDGPSVFLLYLCSCLLLFLNNLDFPHHLSESSYCLLHDAVLNTVIIWKFYVLYSFHFITSLIHTVWCPL